MPYSLKPKAPSEVIDNQDNFINFFVGELKKVTAKFAIAKKALSLPNQRDHDATQYPKLLAAYKENLNEAITELIASLDKEKDRFLVQLAANKKRELTDKERYFVGELYKRYIDSLKKLPTFEIRDLKSILADSQQEYIVEYVDNELLRKRELPVEAYIKEFEKAYALPASHPDKLSIDQIDPAQDIPILQYAVRLNLPTAVAALLALEPDNKKFNINFRKKRPTIKKGESPVEEGPTALHVAAELGTSTIVEILLASGAAAEAVDSNMRTPVHVAAKYKQVAVVKALMLRRVNLTLPDKNGDTPLALAMLNDVSLINRTSSTTNSNQAFQDPREKAEETAKAILSKLPISDMLVKSSPKVKPYTYLEIAISNRLSAAFVTELLQKYGSDNLRAIINLKNSNEMAPLFLAVRTKCDLEVIKLLLAQAETDIDTYDKDQRSALQEAIALENDPTLVKALLGKAKVTTEDLKGNTTLIYALKYNLRFDLLRMVIEKYGKEEITGVINKANKDDGDTPLHYAVKMKPPSWSERIKQKHPMSGEEIEVEKTFGWTDVINLLVTTHGAELNRPNKKGETPLHLALSIAGDTTRAEILLKFPATRVDIDTFQGETTLMLAIRNKFSLKIIESLIQKCGVANLSNYLNKVNKEGKTALFMLIEMMRNTSPSEVNERRLILDCLIRYGADVNICTKDGLSPLHQSLINKHSGIAQILLSVPNIKVTLSDNNGDTTLIHATRNNIEGEVVSKIITAFKAEYEKDESSKQQSEPGHGQVFVALSEFVNRRNKDKSTALSTAIAAPIDINNSATKDNNFAVINILLANSADPTSVDGKGRTTLFQSIIAGRVDIATLFLDLPESALPKNNNLDRQSSGASDGSGDETSKSSGRDDKEKQEQLSGDDKQVEDKPKSFESTRIDNSKKQPVKYAVKIHADDEKEECLAYDEEDYRLERSTNLNVKTRIRSHTALALTLMNKDFPDEFIIKLIERYGDKIRIIIKHRCISYDDKQLNNKQALYIAIQQKKSLAVITKLVEQEGIDLNSLNAIDNRRPLHEAVSALNSLDSKNQKRPLEEVFAEYLKIIELLISKGAEITTTGSGQAPAISTQILELQTGEQSPVKGKLFQKLIELKCKATLAALRMTPLHQALITDNFDSADSMLRDAAEKNSDPAPQPPLLEAILEGDSAAQVQTGTAPPPLVKDSSGGSEGTGSEEEKESIAKTAAPPAAVASRALPVILEPVQLSQSANEKLNARDIYCQTPSILLSQQNEKHKGCLLHHLIKGAYKHLIRALLESTDFDVNKIDELGASPLELAVIQENFDDIVRLLLSKGAKADTQLKPDKVFGVIAGDTAAHLAARLGKDTTLEIFKAHPASAGVLQVRNNKGDTPDSIFEKLKTRNNNGGSGSSSREGSGPGTPTDPLTPRAELPSAASSNSTSVGTSTNTTPRDDMRVDAAAAKGAVSDKEQTDKDAARRRADLEAASNNARDATLISLAQRAGVDPERINIDDTWQQRARNYLKRNKWIILGIIGIVLLLLLSGAVAFGLFCVSPPAVFIWTIAVGKAFTFVVTKTLIGVHIANAATPVIKALAIAVPEIATAALLSIAPAITFTVSAVGLISSAVAAAVLTPIIALTTVAQVVGRFCNWLTCGFFDFRKSDDLAVQEPEPNWANLTKPDPTKKSITAENDASETILARTPRSQNGDEEPLAEKDNAIPTLERTPSEKPGIWKLVSDANDSIVDVTSMLLSCGIFERPNRKGKYLAVPKSDPSLPDDQKIATRTMNPTS